MTTKANGIAFRAVLFDMDGVVVDTHASVTTLWQRLAEKYGVELSSEDFRRHIYGRTAQHTLDVLFPQLTADEQQRVFEEIAIYEAQLSYSPLPGVVALLQALRRRGTPAALVTGATARKVEEVSRQLGLEGLFTAVITGGDIRKGKPDPECYLLAAVSVGQDPKNCVAFEDAVNGVEAAVEAGTQCVGVHGTDSASALLAAGAYATISDFTHLSVRPAATSNTRVYLELS